MKAILTLLITLALGFAPAAEIHSVIIDDFTGPELTANHGIVRTTPEDATALIKAFVGHDFSLGYTAIAESADAQPTVEIKLTAFAIQPPRPVENASTLDLRTLTEASEAYFAEKGKFEEARGVWLASARTEAEAFKRNVIIEQMRTGAVFDRNVTSLGEKYRRSDCAIALVTAARRLSERDGIKLLILNTDCIDSPYGKPSRTIPFTAEEIPTDIVLVFVNTSHRPENSPLFSGLKNIVFTAESLQAAATLIAAGAKDDWASFQSPALFPHPASR